ncbi:MAG: hypothetical protein HEEMFOPI_01914 [Holosporales bacterium]
MLKIIGRDFEKKVLNDLFLSKKAEFLAVYGRRRIGKTYLIREFFSKKKSYFFQITGIKNGLLNDQLYEFTRVLEKQIPQDGIHLKEPKNWLEAFDMLTKSFEAFAKNKKIVLFFDETPWLASKKSRFLESLDYYWNTKWSQNPNIKLIICGSAASWIINRVINDKGGLHNRVTAKLRLDPFSLKETKQFLKSQNIKWSDQQIIELYMITGGVPYYLSLLRRDFSVHQNIDYLCFNKNGILFSEYDNLIPALFDDSTIHKSLIEFIGSHFYGVERQHIIDKLKIPSGGTLNNYLSELEESGFITQFFPYGHKKRGQYYRVVDEYIMFYLHWIAPHMTTIHHMNSYENYWSVLSLCPSYKSWSGYAFESLVYKHLNLVRKTFHIPSTGKLGFYKHVGNDQEPGTQIDLLFDREDNVVNICEIKFNKDPYKIDKDYAKKLIQKVRIFEENQKTKKSLFLSMITLNGVQNNVYAEDLVTNVMTSKDFFE